MLKRKIWFGICILLVLVVAVLYLAYRSAISGPRFYRQALEANLEASLQLGDELEEKILATHNSAVREPAWSISLSDQQLNGWIATHLREQYSRFNPSGISGLCTSFEQEKVRVAFRVQNQFIPIVICIEAVPFVTQDEKNVALRLEQVRAGWIPFSKKNATDRITAALAKSRIPIAWTTDTGKPLGLMRPTFQLAKEVERKLQINSISFVGNHLVISGLAADIE